MNKKIRERLLEIISSERGETLILALIVMILVSLLIGPLLSHMSTGMKNTREVYSVRTAEQYAADAGVAKAMWYIKYQGESVPDDFTVDNINGKTVFVYITSETDEDENVTYSIESRAGSTTINSQVMTTPEIPEAPGEPSVPSKGLFTKAVTALNGNLTFNAGNAAVTGDAHINNGQTVFPSSGSNRITGDIYSSGGISGKGTISGDEMMVKTGSTVGSKISHPNATVTYGTQNFVRPDTQMSALRQQIYNLTYNINTPSPSGAAVSSPIQNKGTSSSYYHYTDQINNTGDLSFTSGNYVVFDQQVCVGGNMSIAGNAYIIFNGGVKISGQLQMTSGGGDVTFNGTLTADSISYSNGMNLIINNNVKVPGSFNAGSGGAMNLAGTLFVGGSFIVTGGRQITANDAVYVVGDISLQNGAYIINSTAAPNAHNKVLVVNGNISMSGGTSLGNVNQIPQIVDLNTSATITMNAGARAYAALYAPDASITLIGNAQVYGSVIAKNITLGNGSGDPGITYYGNLNQRTDLQGYYSDPGSPGSPGNPGSPAGLNLTSWGIN
jgi:hypothetical protein